eukprot:11584794-Alexandrium_andersonii.AAC.1
MADPVEGRALLEADIGCWAIPGASSGRTAQAAVFPVPGASFAGVNGHGRDPRRWRALDRASLGCCVRRPREPGP